MSKVNVSATRMKHNYTNELELKSLAIREKNKKLNVGEISSELNDEIDELINDYKNKKDSDLKQKIIELSEKVQISQRSHEKFGSIIILMIKKILTKPNFSGYSWYDDFYSDSCYRVFRYITNFDHKMKSKITGNEVSCFSYITQIIHNSIICIINEKNIQEKKVNDYIKKYSGEIFGIPDINVLQENESKYEFKDYGKELVIECPGVTEVHEILVKISNEQKGLGNYDKKRISKLTIKTPENLIINYPDYQRLMKIHEDNKFNLEIIRNKPEIAGTTETTEVKKINENNEILEEF